MFYEIRLYSIVPGRFDVTRERYGRHLPQLFARHGIRNVGRWIATAGPRGPMFVYLMAYRDLSERESQWEAFYRDADWYDLRARTQGPEEATERFDLYFMRANSLWSPPSHEPDATARGVHDLQFCEIALGCNAQAYAYLKDIYLPAVERAGGQIMMVADFVSGPSMPRIALMVEWADPTARQQAWLALQADKSVHDALAGQRATFGRALLGMTDTYLLEPTDYAYPLKTLGNPLHDPS